jgi:Outer membrane protein beta-barrel domain
MISDNQMDQFFSNRLRNYPSSVPEDMWDRIVEKKKRDRMLWLFFSRIMIIALLIFGLIGGYLKFNQKKVAANTGKESGIDNKTPIISDTSNARPSNLPMSRNQKQLPQINTPDKKLDQNKKTAINYFDDINHQKQNSQSHVISPQTNASDHGVSPQIENASKNISTSGDSIATNENKTESKKDSLDKKQLIKTPTTDSSKLKEVKKPEKKNEQNNGKWYLDLYASPDYPIVSPHEMEQSKISYSIGIKINRSLGKHFSIKTGIQYSQINIAERDSGTDIIHLKRLDMPILAGYSFGNGNLKAMVNGGVFINLYSWSNWFFKSNTGVSLYLGVNLEKKINEKISVFAEPYYRYQLTNMTGDTIIFTKFVDVVGVNIGVRYHFKKKH